MLSALALWCDCSLRVCGRLLVCVIHKDRSPAVAMTAARLPSPGELRSPRLALVAVGARVAMAMRWLPGEMR